MLVKRIINSSSYISFKESEDYRYDETNKSFHAKSYYGLKQEQINKQFDLKRECFLNNSDCSDPSLDVFWNQLRKIENLRKNALNEIDTVYGNCISKRWNFLKLFSLK